MEDSKKQKRVYVSTAIGLSSTELLQWEMQGVELVVDKEVHPYSAEQQALRESKKPLEAKDVLYNERIAKEQSEHDREIKETNAKHHAEQLLIAVE